MASDAAKYLKYATEHVAEIAKAQAKIDKMVDADLAKQVPEAIKQNDDVILKLKLQALKNATHDIEKNLEATTSCAWDIEQVNEDADFSSEHQTEIQEVCAVIAAARAKLTRQLVRVQELEAAAKKGLEVSADSKEAAQRQFAELEGRINSEKKYLPETTRLAETFADKAKKALDVRDAKGLADAKKGMEDLGIEGLAMYHSTQDFESRLGEFLKKILSKGLEEDLLNEFKSDVKRLLAISEESGKSLKALQDLQKQIDSYAVGEYDVKKALKVLALDPKAQPGVEQALAKILKGPAKDLEKGLDGLVKQYRLSTTGKKMAESLNKAGDSIYK